MNEWIHEWIHEWMNEWMNEWTYEWTCSRNELMPCDKGRAMRKSHLLLSVLDYSAQYSS